VPVFGHESPCFFLSALSSAISSFQRHSVHSWRHISYHAIRETSTGTAISTGCRVVIALSSVLEWDGRRAGVGCQECCPSDDAVLPLQGSAARPHILSVLTAKPWSMEGRMKI
jgi:hypothetical protein